MFYSGVERQIKEAVEVTEKAKENSEQAIAIASDVDDVLRKAKRARAVVDRLEDYVTKLEARLLPK